jgi:cyclopropane fatty-acyl-phospholipid synthase-like methyltransferase
MMSDTPEKKVRFFDRYAAQLAESGYCPHEIARIQALIKRAGVTQGMRVLEPGCGPGHITRMLAECVGESGQVCALDISSEMVNLCQALISGLSHVRVAHCAIEDYTCKESPFNLVFCFNAFPHFNNHPKALSAAFACLAPGGRLVIAHSTSREHVNHVHTSAGGPIGYDLLPVPEALAAMVEKAGFVSLEVDDGEKAFFFSALKP